MVVNGPELRQRCIQFIVSTYPSIRQKHSEEEMESLIGKELKMNLDQETEEVRKHIKRIKKLRGSVIERLPSPGSYSKEFGRHVPKLTRSVSGDCHFQLQGYRFIPVGFYLGKSAYPYESLQTGRKWPSDVNPSKREEHLDRDEFQDIFQVSYDTYCSYPNWKRVQIKKEKKLF